MKMIQMTGLGMAAVAATCLVLTGCQELISFVRPRPPYDHSPPLPLQFKGAGPEIKKGMAWTYRYTQGQDTWKVTHEVADVDAAGSIIIKTKFDGKYSGGDRTQTVHCENASCGGKPYQELGKENVKVPAGSFTGATKYKDPNNPEYAWVSPSVGVLKYLAQFSSPGVTAELESDSAGK